MNDDRGLKEYEDVLRNAITKGELALPVTDAVADFIARRAQIAELPTGCVEKCLEAVGAALMRRALATAKREHGTGEMGLGRYLRLLRESAKAAVDRVAALVRITAGDLRDLEEGETDPLAVPPHAMARISSLFGLNINDLRNLLIFDVVARKSAPLSSLGLARPVGGPSRKAVGLAQKPAFDQLSPDDRNRIEDYILQVGSALRQI